MAKARKTTRRGASRAKSKPSRRAPTWLIAVFGIMAGLFIAFLFQLEPGRTTVKRDASPPATPAKQVPAKPKSQSPNYDFYTLLPESEVAVPKGRVDEPAPEPKAELTKEQATPAQSSTRYYLQAGSFRQRAEADKVRAQIILMGLDVRLEDAKLANGEVWHRVQVGPFADRNKLNHAQKTLAGNGFDNLLMQQRTATP